MTTIDLEPTTSSADTTRPADAGLASYLRQLQEDVESLPTDRPVVAAVVPADDEGETIAEVLRSPLEQTRLPADIPLIVNVTEDDTCEKAAKSAGAHSSERTGEDGSRQRTEVHGHDRGANPGTLVGALDHDFSLIGHADSFWASTGTPPWRRTRLRSPRRRSSPTPGSAASPRLLIILGSTWSQLPVLIQSSILWLGWPVLHVVTIAQTIAMTGGLSRRQRAYEV